MIIKTLFARHLAPPPRAMIVCLCKGVSSRTIHDEIRRGNCTVKDIARACEAGTGCGACVTQIRDLIAASAVGVRPHSDGSSKR